MWQEGSAAETVLRKWKMKSENFTNIFVKQTPGAKMWFNVETVAKLNSSQDSVKEPSSVLGLKLGMKS